MSDATTPIQVQFLSTLSLRRATSSGYIRAYILPNFYPRSPCGERLTALSLYVSKNVISIHALLAESDAYLSILFQKFLNFYPRSPCGERRWLRCWQLAARDISIHALLAESDWPGLLARPFFIISIHALLAESDTWARGSRVTYVISIHALLAESDMDMQIASGMVPVFLSTLSLRRATRA